MRGHGDFDALLARFLDGQSWQATLAPLAACSRSHQPRFVSIGTIWTNGAVRSVVLEFMPNLSALRPCVWCVIKMSFLCAIGVVLFSTGIISAIS